MDKTEAKQNTAPKVTAGIVTHDSEGDIRTVLASLTRQMPEESVYVSDNGSKDRTVSIVKEEFPGVHLIERTENIGFGAGNNAVIKEVDSEYHIISNPDIEVPEGTVKALADCMDAHPDIVCITPKFFYPDGTEQFVPKKYPAFRYLLGGRLGKHFPKAQEWRDEYTGKNREYHGITDIDFCMGCFLFTRTEALKKAGGFDERYFLYFEDADLTRTLQQYGRTVYDPDVSVIHRWQRESAKSAHYLRIHIASMFRYFSKWGFRF